MATRKESNVYRISAGDGFLRPAQQLRFKAPIRDICFDETRAVVLGVAKGASLLAEFDPTTGEERWRRDDVPQLSGINTASDGTMLGSKRPARIGAGPSLLYFLSSNGAVLHEATVPDATSEVVHQAGVWFVGCRDGGLYAFSAKAAPLWRWQIPPHKTEAKASPYYLVAARDEVILSSFGDIYAVGLDGHTRWHRAIPDDGYSTVGLTARLDAEGDPKADIELRYGTQAAQPEPSQGQAGTVSVSITLGFPSSVLALYVVADGYLAGSTSGSVHWLDRSGEIRQTQSFGRSGSLLLVTAGTLRAARSEGALYWLRDGNVVAQISEGTMSPSGMVSVGEAILLWRTKHLEIWHPDGRKLWAAEFAASIRSVEVYKDRVWLISDVATGFKYSQ